MINCGRALRCWDSTEHTHKAENLRSEVIRICRCASGNKSPSAQSTPLDDAVTAPIRKFPNRIISSYLARLLHVIMLFNCYFAFFKKIISLLTLLVMRWTPKRGPKWRSRSSTGLSSLRHSPSVPSGSWGSSNTWSMRTCASTQPSNQSSF